jgi:hypothetical protein
LLVCRKRTVRLLFSVSSRGEEMGKGWANGRGIAEPADWPEQLPKASYK